MKIEANSQWSCLIVCGVKICKHTGTCAKFQRSESRLCVFVCLYNCDYHFSCGHILLCIAFMNLLQLPLSLRRQVTWTMVHEMCPEIFKNCSNNYKTSRIRYKECYVVPSIFLILMKKLFRYWILPVNRLYQRKRNLLLILCLGYVHAYMCAWCMCVAETLTESV